MDGQSTTSTRGDPLPPVRRRLIVPALPMGPASMLAQTASCFACDTFILCGNRMANAKSLMSLLALKITGCTHITILAQGDDAEDAVDTIIEFLESEFDDPEGLFTCSAHMDTALPHAST